MPTQQQHVISRSSSSKNDFSESIGAAATAALKEATEKVALEYLYFGIRKITAILDRSEIITSRKKVYQLIELPNLLRKRSVRKHVMLKWILTIPERPDHLWQYDTTYI